MMDRTLVEIVCDGGGKIGIGHIRRSSALAESLKKENIETRLVGLSEAAKKMLPAIDADNRKAGLILFDVAEGIENEINHAKQNGQTTVTLDWFGNTVPDVNIAVYPHNEVKALKEKYIGFEYIVLRDEILKQQPKPFNGQANKVFVCLGGGDLLGQGFDAANFLKKKGLDTTLVQGPLAKTIPGEHGFTILTNPPDFPELFNHCDWAVTNGGGCLFEALYLGKATYVLPQTEWEMRIAMFAQKAGVVLGIGKEGLKKFSAEELSPVTQQKKKLVDGRGAERIAAIIKKLI